MSDDTPRRSRLLLDSHVLIWALTDSPSLTSRLKAVIADAAEVVVSAASVWEIEIRRRKGSSTFTRAFSAT